MQEIKNFIKNKGDIIIGIIFFIYFICLLFLSKLIFKYIFLVASILLIAYHYTKHKLRTFRIYKYIRGVSIFLLMIFLIIESLILFYPKNNTNESDYIIVLGALVNKNTISKTLKDRLDATIEYSSKSKNDVYIVVSGGQGRGENISEARAMKNYLVKNQVDEKFILEEDRSTTTEENFKFSKDIIEKHSNDKINNLKIKIITTDFHSFRSSLMARNNDFEDYNFYTSKTKYYLAPLNYVREFFATIYYIFIHINS